MFFQIMFSAILALLLISCDALTGGGGSSGSSSGGTDSSSNSLTFGSADSVLIETKSCTSFSFEVKNKDVAVSGVSITLAIEDADADDSTVTELAEADLGTLTDSSIVTGADGIAKGEFCAGKEAATVIISASASGKTASSSEISIVSAASIDKLEPVTLTNTSIYTAGANVNNCVSVQFIATKEGEKTPGQLVKFSLSTDGSEVGTLSPEEIESDFNGVVSTAYCSGEKEVKISIIAKAGVVNANSAELDVVIKPDFEFTYQKSLLPVSSEDEGGVLELNLLDAGPRDCTTLFFRLTKSGVPVVGEQVTFYSQPNYPKKAKVAAKEVADVVVLHPDSGLSVSSYESTSNVDGDFAVPVCAGVEIGTLLITGVYVDELDRTFEAKSPVIKFNSGVINYANMSVTYETTNARTLRGFFETNTTEEHKFTLKLGTTSDGDPITTDPVIVATEIGKLAVANAGIPQEDGTVQFTMLPLNLGAIRPYVVETFGGVNPLAVSRCDVLQLSARATTLGVPVPYTDVKKNWNTKIVYAVAGQEQYYDRNSNGEYDVGGAGFWDKNQDGLYDVAVDLLHGDFGSFDVNSEWFIDLPSPFVDVNDNNVFEENVDITIGNSYIEPNGVRDLNTLVWRSFDVPIYMGITQFAMYNAVVQSNLAQNDSDLVTPVGEDYFSTLTGLGINSIGTPPLLDSVVFPSAVTPSQEFQYVFMHGICGNAPLGGTEISIAFEDLNEPAVGPREFTGHIYQQPGDSILESARRLLSNPDGSSSARVNYNVSDHRSADYSFPVAFKLRVAECQNECAGDLATPGFICDARSGRYLVNIDGNFVSNSISAPAVMSCTCMTGASLVSGACTCPEGTAGYSFTNVCEPAPTVTSINLQEQPAGTSVTISGSNFMAAPSPPDVSIGGGACTPVVVVNATTLTCNVPIGESGTLGDITVTNPDTQAGTLTSGYKFEP